MTQYYATSSLNMMPEPFHLYFCLASQLQLLSLCSQNCLHHGHATPTHTNALPMCGKHLVSRCRDSRTVSNESALCDVHALHRIILVVESSDDSPLEVSAAMQKLASFGLAIHTISAGHLPPLPVLSLLRLLVLDHLPKVMLRPGAGLVKLELVDDFLALGRHCC